MWTKIKVKTEIDDFPPKCLHRINKKKPDDNADRNGTLFHYNKKQNYEAISYQFSALMMSYETKNNISATIRYLCIVCFNFFQGQ